MNGPGVRWRWSLPACLMVMACSTEAEAATLLPLEPVTVEVNETLVLRLAVQNPSGLALTCTCTCSYTYTYSGPDRAPAGGRGEPDFATLGRLRARVRPGGWPASTRRRWHRVSSA